MNKQKFYCWLFYLLPVVYFLSLPIATGDLAVWVAQGKHFLLHGEILRHDIYSVLSTRDLVYPVGTCVLYALIYSFSGLIGVSLFHKLVVLLISFFWHHFSLSKIKEPWSYPSLLVIFFAWFGCSMFWIDRPALLGMLPLILSFVILQKEEELTPHDVVALVLINIVWVNLHGSWPLLIMMYVWRELTRTIILKKSNIWQQLVATSSLLLSILINPFGYKVFAYLFETASLSRERHIDEWAAPSITGPYASQSAAYFLLLLLTLVFGVFLFKKSRSKFFKSLTSPYFPLVLFAFSNIRNTALPFFILIPFACEFILIKGKSEVGQERKSAFNVVFVSFVLFCGFLFLPMIKPYSRGFLPQNKREVFDSSAPFSVTEFLNNTKDSDPVFNDWEYGSFLILAQKHPIFIDTRNIIYDRSEFGEYSTVIVGNSGWDKILDKYKIRYVLLNRKLRTNLIEKLNSSLRWKSVVVDSETILFQRKN